MFWQSSAKTMKQIRLEGISKIFANHKVLTNISFEVSEEEFCVLVGPSGCGKTTILRIIAGLEQPSSGCIYFNGNLWNDLPPGERKVGMVFQNYALYPHLTVYENIAFPLLVKKFEKREIQQRVEKIAELLNLKDKLKYKPKELSGGERQRVALGRAIIREPNVFLFDEPLSNLDAKLRVVMRSEIVNLCKQLRTPSIYVTHDQVEALTMGTKIVVLNAGVIQQIGTPEEVYFKPSNTFVATFIGVPPMNLFEGRIEHGFFRERNGLFSIKIQDLDVSSRDVILGIRPEDVFLSTEVDSIIKTFVKTIEYVGYESIVYFEHSGKLYSFIVSGNAVKPNISEIVHLGFKINSLHIFDSSGKRLN